MNLRITVDGEALMDGPIGTWTDNPPEFVRDVMKANLGDKPWMKHLQIITAEFITKSAAGQATPTMVDVHTSPGGWSMHVKVC